MAIGWISSTPMTVRSPGMHDLGALGQHDPPVTSVVRK